MGIRSYIRERIINAVRFAVREELNANISQVSLTPEENVVKQVEDILAPKIDKQIERWTWERYKRIDEVIVPKVDKQIERWTWERYKRMDQVTVPKIEKQIDLNVWNLQKNLDKSAEHWTWERYKRIENTVVPKLDKRMEHWTWERYGRILNQFQIVGNQLAYYENRIPYFEGEKIRIAILYQIPSCWPSIESVYNCLMHDDRFEVTLLLYDREQKEPAQMAGAREYLESNAIPYEEAEYYNFRLKRPHILLYQTPWDDVHRPDFLKSDAISSLGIRVAYVPYGINYSASVYPDFVFSDNKFKVKPWLMCCLSEELVVDHQMLSKYGGHYAVATGLPKFDSLFHKEQFQLSDMLMEKIGSSKVVFIQMHFADKGGNPYIPVPNITEYLKFFKKMSDYENCFFLVRPHPKFFELYEKNGYQDEVDEMIDIIEKYSNAYLYDEADYRPALFQADCVVGDRSALMVEAAVLDIPVLYMTNFYYQEQMLPSIEPIFESYYQGNTAYDIEQFLDYVVEKGHDYKKEERRAACKKCIPYFDGLCGKRIVDTIAKVISMESRGQADG